MATEPTLTGLVSISVPVFNEVEAISPLYDSTRKVMQAVGRPWEIIFVDDGSTDGSGEKLDEMAAGDPHVRVVHFRRNFGQTAAMMAGFDHASGEVIIPMDGDAQNDPADIPRMLEKIEAWRMWVLCDRLPVKNWTKGNVTLLGDAAHPTLQYLAQGANMATEDAVQIAHDVSLSPGDLNAAFKAYNSKRYLRTARIQTNSRVYGQFYHASGVVAELRDQFFQERTQEEALKSTKWLYAGGDPV
jgi:glycosyltransferase involved in cell wall biosynthesis